jgi:hypothetical protein
VQGFWGKRIPLLRQELGEFDSAYRIPDQVAEFPALLIANCGSQILNLDKPLPNEDDLRRLFNAGDPGIPTSCGSSASNPAGSSG